MKRFGSILQGIILGILLFIACFQYFLLQNPDSKDSDEPTRIFTYQFY